jgi:hypothetical protein
LVNHLCAHFSLSGRASKRSEVFAMASWAFAKSMPTRFGTSIMPTEALRMACRV